MKVYKGRYQFIPADASVREAVAAELGDNADGGSVERLIDRVGRVADALTALIVMLHSSGRLTDDDVSQFFHHDYFTEKDM
jgi:hypothetical protein